MIDKRTLEFILGDQREEIKSRAEEILCTRIEEGLIDLKSSQAQVVIGVRRSGKSTLCYQALHNAGVNYAYIDFDDERLVGIRAEQLNDVLEVLYKIYGDFNYLFIDEVQNVEGWHLFVNRLLRRKMHVVITGSNAKLLSGELATHLTGRNKEIALYPLSFAEFCHIRNVDTELKTTKAEAFRRAAFDDYMNQGGFPELMTIDINESKRYVNTLVDNILKRDIEQRYRIVHKATFERFAHHLMNIAPAILSTRDIAATFQLTEHTVRNYAGHLKQAYLMIGVEKYSRKSKIRAVQEKLYPVDVAIMNRRENAFAGKNLGYRLETIVLVHLMRKCKADGLDVYYLNDRSGECDFLVCRDNAVLEAVQVSYDISSEKTRQRELSGLVLAAKETGCQNLLLLTDHESGTIEYQQQRIVIQPVYEWCVNLF